MMPEDYEGGIGEMMKSGGKGDSPYEDLKPLDKRETTSVKLQGGAGGDEAELLSKYGWSSIPAALSAMTKKLYGYQRDSNVHEPLQQSAIRGSNALADFLFDAPCLNRAGRMAEEEAKAKQAIKLIDHGADKRKDGPDLDELLQRWSSADAFMMQVQIVEEQDGIEAAKPFYPRFIECRRERKQVEMAAAELSPGEYSLFGCRRRQYGIMRERSYDLAMNFPIHDFTEVKREIAEGGDIHDLVYKMPWAFRESYHMAMSTMLDGEAHRTTLMALIAGQLPAQPPPMPWQMGGGGPPNWQAYGGNPNMNGQGGEDGEDGPPDKRKSIFGLSLGGQNGGNQPPQAKPIRRRSRGKR